MKYIPNLLRIQGLIEDYGGLVQTVTQCMTQDNQPRLSRRGFFKKVAVSAVSLAIANASFAASKKFQLDLGPYGEIGYTAEGHSHVYIIPGLHRKLVRDADDKKRFKNTYPETPRVQAEIYKIIEKLHTEEDVSLLLDESYFAYQQKFYWKIIDKYIKAQVGIDAFANIQEKLRNPTIENLEKVLANESLVKPASFVVEGKVRYTSDINATVLLALKALNDYPQLKIRGAEDEGLYDIDKVNGPSTGLSEDQEELLHKFRSAKVLQNIPMVIEGERRKNSGMNRSAIAVVGITHLDEIITFLDERRIRVETFSPMEVLNKGRASEETLRLLRNGIDEPLKLLEEGYDVSIVFPETINNMLSLIN